MHKSLGAGFGLRQGFCHVLWKYFWGFFFRFFYFFRCPQQQGKCCGFWKSRLRKKCQKEVRKNIEQKPYGYSITRLILYFNNFIKLYATIITHFYPHKYYQILVFFRPDIFFSVILCSRIIETNLFTGGQML